MIKRTFDRKREMMGYDRPYNRYLEAQTKTIYFGTWHSDPATVYYSIDKPLQNDYDHTDSCKYAKKLVVWSSDEDLDASTFDDTIKQLEEGWSSRIEDDERQTIEDGPYNGFYDSDGDGVILESLEEYVKWYFDYLNQTEANGSNAGGCVWSPETGKIMYGNLFFSEEEDEEEEEEEEVYYSEVEREAKEYYKKTGKFLFPPRQYDKNEYDERLRNFDYEKYDTFLFRVTGKKIPYSDKDIFYGDSNWRDDDPYRSMVYEDYLKILKKYDIRGGRIPLDKRREMEANNHTDANHKYFHVDKWFDAGFKGNFYIPYDYGR